MRHVFAPRPVASRPHGMPQPPPAAGLVAPAGGPLGTVAGTPRALSGAVNLAAVAAAADQRLGATARAHKQPGCRGAGVLGSIDVSWTNATIAGILARHACPARCGARRRAKPPSLTSAPCLPLDTGKHLPRHAALLTSIPPGGMRNRLTPTTRCRHRTAVKIPRAPDLRGFRQPSTALKVRRVDREMRWRCR
jgi:hypothetical protein